MVKMNKALIVVCILSLSIAGLVSQAPAKDLVFGWTGRDMTPPYARAMEFGAERKAKELGIKLLVKDSQNDILKQLSHLDSFLVMGVDGLVFEGTIDTRAVIPGIKKFNDKKIPIVALDNSPEGGFVNYWISFDIAEASKKAGEYFIKGIKDRNKGQVPQGVVIEITGALGDAFTNECTSGLHSVLDQYKQLEVVQGEGKWNNIDSFKRASDLLTRHRGKVVGIYVHTPDIMGPGVVQAVEKAGLDPAQFSISGICMGPEGRDLIKEGKIYTIVGQPALAAAELGVQYLHDIIKGKKDMPQEGDTITVKDALWSPAKVIKNPRCDGLMVRLNAPAVPFEAKPDDPRLWENILTK
ncbi:MAG: sugar ABC transporter substrate-binding protein [Deltaproteobacteria bacterium]|nr:sugar ABC transporter substrate-binding protein [Deltaproteobacteria bacterium]